MAELKAAFNRADFGNRCAGDLPADHVDDPADGGAAVEKGGGAAEDFDALDQEGLGSDGVVGAGTGGVECFDPGIQDTHPRAVKAADDRSARAASEAGGGDAELSVQQVA